MVVDRLARRIRTSGANPTQQEYSHWPSWPWASPSTTGATVNDATALSLPAFYRGVSLIASTIAGLPLHVHHELADGTNERLRSEDTAYLWRRPNPEMTKQTLWERVVADEVRGNGFLWVQKDDNGQPAAIWHLERQRVKVGRTRDKRKVYEVDNELPMIDYKEGGEIVHIPNWGDSLVGYDPIRVAAQAIALGLSAEEYAARTFGGGQVPPGIISTTQELTVEQSDALAARWRKLHGGVSKSQDIAVLGNGATFQKVSQDLENMQMGALRAFQAEEIARLLGIPPHLLGITEKVTSWGSGIAELGQGFVTYTLNPHVTRIKQAIDDALLVRELTDRYVEFDPGGLLRGNLIQQYTAHSIGIKNGFITPNEARKDLDLPPLDGGDKLVMPMNVAPVGTSEGAPPP